MTVDARTAEFRRRRELACRGLVALGAQALVTDRPESLRYLTGYQVGLAPSRPFIAVLLSTGELTLVVPGLTAWSIQRAAVDVRLDIYERPALVPSEWVMPDGEAQFAPVAFERMRAVVAEAGVERVAVDGLNAVFPPITRLDAALSGTEVVDGSKLLWDMRIKKSDWELDQLREAARRAGAAYDLLASQLRTGMTEIEIQRLVSNVILDSGAGVGSAKAMVVEDGREIVGGPTDRSWEAGELLYVDVAALFEGYTSDFCRMYVAGEPSAQQAAAYQRLVDARDAAVAAFQPGITAGKLASEMVNVLGVEPAAGRYGHGIGLAPALLEPPSLHPVDPTVMEEGTAFCIEPYLIDGGSFYCFEEEYVVRDGRLELLSPPMPRELIQIDPSR